MERKHIPEPESKLTILYALRGLGPVTDTELLQFLVELDLMNYFTMQLNLCDMEEQGQLRTLPHPAGNLLEPTAEGLYTLEAFAQRIPVSRRGVMDGAFPAWRARFRAEQQAPADSFTLKDGSVCLHLRLLEGGVPLMDAVLTLPGDEAPTLLEKRWRAAAPAVYDAVNRALADGFQPDEPPAELPPCAAVQRLGGQEWLLSLTDTPEHPAITLLLTLADEALARHCAARWPSCCRFLRERMLQELRDGLNEQKNEKKTNISIN